MSNFSMDLLEVQQAHSDFRTNEMVTTLPNIYIYIYIFPTLPNLPGRLVIDLSLLQISSLHWDPLGHI